MSVEDHRVAGGYHADAVVDQSAGGIGDRRQGSDQSDRCILQQHQTVVAAERAWLNVFHAGRLAGAQDVLPYLVFITAEVRLFDGHRRHLLVTFEDTSTNRGDDVPAPLKRHGNEFLLSSQARFNGVVHRREKSVYRFMSRTFSGRQFLKNFLN